MYVSQGFHARLIRGVYIRRRQASAACASTHGLPKVSASTLALAPTRTLLKLLLLVLDNVLVLRVFQPLLLAIEPAGASEPVEYMRIDKARVAERSVGVVRRSDCIFVC